MGKPGKAKNVETLTKLRQNPAFKAKEAKSSFMYRMKGGNESDFEKMDKIHKITRADFTKKEWASLSSRNIAHLGITREMYSADEWAQLTDAEKQKFQSA